MKRWFQPVEVEVTKGWPVVVNWNGRRHRVQYLVDAWVVQGKWWAEEERRVYFRVHTTGGTLDIFRSGDDWILSKVQD
ncbi:MAG: hypothetical protein E2O84_05575 [Bacteroidetes bacterium]|nr:MAG: hypothetical protein E2O84_05575 [Bacteroidota bacterium]